MAIGEEVTSHLIFCPLNNIRKCFYCFRRICRVSLKSADKIRRLVGLLLLAEVHSPCSEIVRQHTGRK